MGLTSTPTCGRVRVNPNPNLWAGVGVQVNLSPNLRTGILGSGLLQPQPADRVSGLNPTPTRGAGLGFGLTPTPTCATESWDWVRVNHPRFRLWLTRTWNLGLGLGLNPNPNVNPNPQPQVQVVGPPPPCTRPLGLQPGFNPNPQPAPAGYAPFSLLCGRSLCVRVFVAEESGEFAFLSVGKDVSCVIQCIFFAFRPRVNQP